MLKYFRSALISASLYLALIVAATLGGIGTAQAWEACPSPGQLRSKPSNIPTTITFRLDRNYAFPVDIMWLDFNGRLKKFARIVPGQSFTQNTFAGHIWVAKDGPNCEYGWAKSRPVTVRLVNDNPGGITNQQSQSGQQSGAAPRAGNCRMPSRWYKSKKVQSRTYSGQSWQRSGKAAQVIFTNKSNRTVTTYWMDHTGKANQWSRIRPGKSLKLPSIVGTYWYAKAARGRCVMPEPRLLKPGNNWILLR